MIFLLDAFAQQVHAVLVHRHTLLAGFLGQQSVERFRKPQLELAAVVLLACGLGDGDAVLKAASGPAAHF